MIRRPPPRRAPRGRAVLQSRAAPGPCAAEGPPLLPAWSGLPAPDGFRRALLPGPDVVPS